MFEASRKMKILLSIIILFSAHLILGQSLSNIAKNSFIYSETPKTDSMHSSMILEVRYESDTLYIKARHYAICCEKFVSYVEKKENLSQINFVVKSINKSCLCESEKIMNHKIYAKEITRDIQLRINGTKPKFGITEYLTTIEDPKKCKWKKKKTE